MTDATDRTAPGFSMNGDRVARRALVLAAIVCRGFIESDADHADADALRHRVLDWLTQLDLMDELEPSEEEVLLAPLGTLSREDVLRATWYVEGLAVLAWALRCCTFPRHDQEVDPPVVADSVRFLSEDAEDLIRTARLRPMHDLEACRELLYDIHARLRDYLRNGGRKDFARWVETAWIDAIEFDKASLIVHNDLAIDGKEISDVDDSRVRACEHIIRERHRAIIWLLERYPFYSQTPVDT